MKYIAISSPGMARIPYLDSFLAGPVVPLSQARRRGAKLQAVAGWGNKQGKFHAEAEAYAQQHGLPYWRLEDGFLRSFGTARYFPSVSLIVDTSGGIYYDSTRPSALEERLQACDKLLIGREAKVERAMHAVVKHGLSKYNNGRPLPPKLKTRLQQHRGPKLLIVDQTLNDLSVSGAHADSHAFERMLQAARSRHPGALVVIKTHPEVSEGSKAGYFSNIKEDENTLLVSMRVEPYDLLAEIDEVYTVSSQLGFEALLAAKPVHCFGLPWYAGWGVTVDHIACPRRTRKRSVAELFAAAYLDYTRYIDPETGRLGSIFHAIDWLVRQKQHAQRFPGRVITVAFKRWRRSALKSVLCLHPEELHFARNSREAARLASTGNDTLLFWGAVPPKGVRELAQETGARLCHLEDGFIRSVGLGTDRIPPHSLVFDPRGLYFDPSQASTLEHLLLNKKVGEEDLDRARQIRALIVQHRMTKYNLERHQQPGWHAEGREVILVPGQVADDASVRLGAGEVNSNAKLLQAARMARPDAYIVYKPHPDVASGNRKGRLALAKAVQWADHIETQASIISCIEACDSLHTMTSLSGFDALLREKKVVVYGRPFYAGWGLTEDRLEALRPRRALSLDELVAITLLYYPIYWNWTMRGASSCEAVVNRLLLERIALEQSGYLERLRSDRFLRFRNKAYSYLKGWL